MKRFRLDSHSTQNARREWPAMTTDARKAAPWGPQDVPVNSGELVEALASLWDEVDVRLERQERQAGRRCDWVTPPPGFDRGRIAERARRALDEWVGPAVSGDNGHDRTYHACSVLLLRYAMTVDEAYPLLE